MIDPAPPPTDPTPAPPPAPDPAPVDPTPPAPDPTPAPAPPPPAIGPDGKLSENWFLALGDEFAPHAKDLGKYKDLRHVVQQLDYYRKNGVEYPGQDADPKTVERWNSIAKVPESPDGYGLNPETMKLPEGMAFDTELAGAIAKAAHATHTPPAALSAIAGAFNEILAARTADAAKAQAMELKAAQDALVAEWRGDFQTNASTVRHLTGKLAEAAGIAPEDPAVAQMANSPAFARIMMQVAALTSEDRTRQPSTIGDLRSPAQMIAEITSGRDPVWGQKWTHGTREEKTAAYEHVSKLREMAAR